MKKSKKRSQYKNQQRHTKESSQRDPYKKFDFKASLRSVQKSKIKKNLQPKSKSKVKHVRFQSKNKNKLINKRKGENISKKIKSYKSQRIKKNLENIEEKQEIKHEKEQENGEKEEDQEGENGVDAGEEGEKDAMVLFQLEAKEQQEETDEREEEKDKEKRDQKDQTVVKVQQKPPTLELNLGKKANVVEIKKDVSFEKKQTDETGTSMTNLTNLSDSSANTRYSKEQIASYEIFLKHNPIISQKNELWFAQVQYQLAPIWPEICHEKMQPLFEKYSPPTLRKVLAQLHSCAATRQCGGSHIKPAGFDANGEFKYIKWSSCVQRLRKLLQYWRLIVVKEAINMLIHPAHRGKELFLEIKPVPQCIIDADKANKGALYLKSVTGLVNYKFNKEMFQFWKK